MHIDRESQDRYAGELALKIIRNRVARRGYKFNPHENDHWDKVCKKYGLEVSEAIRYFKLVILPAAVDTLTGSRHVLPAPNDPEDLKWAQSMSLRILPYIPLTLDIWTNPEQIVSLARRLDVGVNDILAIYRGYVLPKLDVLIEHRCINLYVKERS